jgi:hypothetical protein
MGWRSSGCTEAVRNGECESIISKKSSSRLERSPELLGERSIIDFSTALHSARNDDIIFSPRYVSSHIEIRWFVKTRTTAHRITLQSKSNLFLFQQELIFHQDNFQKFETYQLQELLFLLSQHLTLI